MPEQHGKPGTLLWPNTEQLWTPEPGFSLWKREAADGGGGGCQDDLWGAGLDSQISAEVTSHSLWTGVVDVD